MTPPVASDRERARSRLIPLLCLTAASSTFPVGAFPALLPDLDRVVGLSNVELGALAGGFGFARMLLDVPFGLFVARHPAWALRLSPLMLSIGILVVASGGPFPVLLGGRILMGMAHSLGMVAWLTTILRHPAGGRLGAALNAFEFSAMLGMLGGVTLLGLLPGTLPWNLALLVACLPQVTGVIVAPLVAASASRSSAAAPAASVGPSVEPGRAATRIGPLVVLAFAAGTTLATSYSMVELFMIPLRGSREFDLDRGGVARVLMLAQTCDIVALLPVGFLADRAGPTRLLGLVMLAMGVSTSLIAFGGPVAFAVGAGLMGLGMAGWMLPLAVLRRETSPAQVPWRTALYRVGVDGGLFLGPFAAGLLGAHIAVLPAALTTVLLLLGVILLTRRGN